MRRLLFWILIVAPGVLFGLAILNAHHGAQTYVCGPVDRFGCSVGAYRHRVVPWTVTQKLALFGVMAVVYLIIYAIVRAVEIENAAGDSDDKAV